MAVATILAGVSLAFTVGGAIASASAQQSAADQNARAQAQIAQANADAARQTAEINALADLSIARTNADALMATAEAEAQIAEANAKRYEVSAVATEEAGRAEEERARTRSRLLLADMRSRYGASGVLIEGSPLEALAFSAGQEELDALTIRFNTGVKAEDLRSQAGAARLEGMFGVQDAATRARNLLSDAITRGETGITTARIQGQTGLTEARLRGAAGINNANSSALGTIAGGIGSAFGSSATQRAADALFSRNAAATA